MTIVNNTYTDIFIENIKVPPYTSTSLEERMFDVKRVKTIYGDLTILTEFFDRKFQLPTPNLSVIELYHKRDTENNLPYIQISNIN